MSEKMELLLGKAKRITDEKQREQSKLIEKALNHCGYDGEPTVELLEECFLTFVDTGAFSNLTTDEAASEIESGEISIEDMCKNLLKVR